jgi:hypothetical protein
MIHPETEIVATRYDAGTRTCHYTIERDGKRWTASIPLGQFENMGFPGKGHEQRRNHLAAMLENAMRGKPDLK